MDLWKCPSAISLSHNIVLHAQIEHIDLDIHFIKENVYSKKLLIKHILAFLQIVDTLINSLGNTTFLDLRINLIVGLQPP